MIKVFILMELTARYPGNCSSRYFVANNQKLYFLLPLYYPIVYPFAEILMQLDMKTDNKRGTESDCSPKIINPTITTLRVG